MSTQFHLLTSQKNKAYNPLVNGSWIGGSLQSANTCTIHYGSIGFFTGGYLLTAAHVVPENLASLHQPPFGKNYCASPVANGPFPIRRHDKDIDVALCKLNPDVQINKDSTFNKLLNVAGSKDPKIAMKVFKYGCATGYTEGTIVSVKFGEDSYHHLKITPESFANEGDSGASVYTVVDDEVYRVGILRWRLTTNDNVSVRKYAVATPITVVNKFVEEILPTMQ